jgi:DeoR family fructose operon transcriptional repressor
MLAVERKSLIIEYLEKNGKAEVIKLSKTLGVVPETIRRDLKELEARGLLQKTHGGAFINIGKEQEFPVTIREIKYSVEKDMLCARAAKFIEDGDMIFVDNSSTLVQIINHIDNAINVTLLTNSVMILEAVSKRAFNNLTVICSGGVFNKKNMSLSGSVSSYLSKLFFPTKAFISCHGLSLDHGFTDGRLQEAEFKLEMMEVSRKVFCLADHSKLGKVGPVKLCGLDDCDVLITDTKPDEDFISRMQKLDPDLELLY